MSADKRPIWVINRRRAILSLRVVMTLAVAATTLPHLRSPKGLALAILAFYGLSNLLLLSEKASSRLQRLPPSALFIFDLAVVITLMLLTGETRSQFYVVFFLIILMAALARSARAATVIACVSAFLYGLLVGIREPEELLRIEFTTHIALFFVTALFAGYLAEEVHAERSERHRFEGFYRTLFDVSTDGFLVAGPDGAVSEANGRAREILGADPSGLPLHEVLRMSASQIGLTESPTEQDTPLFFKTDITRADGRTLTCEIEQKPFAVGGRSYRLIRLRDVTPARRTQQRMAELERMSILGQLVSSITHEINNPLTVILGYSELILANPPNDEVEEYASQIHEAGRRSKRVVEGFLNQYRSRPFNPAPIKLGDAVRGAMRLMEFHMRYHLVKVDLDFRDEVTVLADPQQIEQLLTNLAANAVQAMQGRPTRHLRVSMAVGPREATVAMKDSGCGIPPEVLARLFEPGFTASINGHGLGLALSREIIHRHGGEITVESRVGEGSTFTVHLPTAT